MKWRSLKPERFYDRFLDEEKLKEISDAKNRERYWTYPFSISIFCLCCATFPTFTGYNFENPYAISMFCFEMFYHFWILYFSVRFLKLDLRYHVFRNRKLLFFIPIPFLVLAIAFSIAAIFTAHFISYPDSSFLVKFTPWYYFLIFLPLFLAYLFFCYCAFMKCFANHTRMGNHEKNRRW